MFSSSVLKFVVYQEKSPLKSCTNKLKRSSEYLTSDAFFSKKGINNSPNFSNLETILEFRQQFWQPTRVVFSLYILHIPPN